jgi:nucleotide-binding universal stress UspA family protein
MDLRALKRILVPTDFSDPSAEALATAMTLAQASGATLDLVHVAVEASFALPPPIDVATVPIDITKLMERVTEGLATEERRVVEAGLRCETAMLVGRPDAEIVARAARPLPRADRPEARRHGDVGARVNSSAPLPAPPASRARGYER